MRIEGGCCTISCAFCVVRGVRFIVEMFIGGLECIDHSSEWNF